MTKTIRLGENGRVEADGAAGWMSSGSAARARYEGTAPAAWLAGLLDAMPSHRALAIGRLRDGLDERVAVVVKGREDGRTTVARTRDHLAFADGPGPLLLDHDRKGMPAAVAGQLAAVGGFEGALAQLIPGYDALARVARASTSAGLHRTDTGERFPGSGGQHVYLFLADQSDARRALEVLHQRAWLAGFGWLTLSGAGQVLERSLVDVAVGSPERLVFEGAPLLQAPLAQDTHARRAVPREGRLLDSRAALPDLTLEEAARFRRLLDEAHAAIKPQEAIARAAHVERRARAIAERSGLDLDEARKQVQAAYRGELRADVLLPFDRLGEVPVRDVLANPERYADETLADPMEGIAYGRGKAKLFVNPDGSILVHSFAHGGGVYVLRARDGGRIDDLLAQLRGGERVALPKPEDAQAAVRAAIERFCAGEVPKMVIKAPEGLGKTELVAQAIALWCQEHEEGTVEVYGGTLVQARELITRLRELGVDALRMPSFAGEDEDGTPYCAKRRLVGPLARAGAPVGESLCYRPALGRRPPSACPRADECRRIEILRRRPRVWVGTHAAMVAERPKRPDLQRPDPAMVIVDESPVPALLDAERLPLSLLGSKGYAKDDKPVVRAVLQAFLNDGDPSQAAAPDDFARLAQKAGWDARGSGDTKLTPDVSEQDARARLARRHRERRKHGKRLRPALAQKLWQALAAQAADGHERVWVYKPERKEGEVLEGWQARWVVHVGQRHAINVPCARVLLLDAGADPMLTERFLPGAEFVDARCRVNAVLVKVTDAPQSKAEWLGRSERQRRQGKRARSATAAAAHAAAAAEAAADPRSNLMRLERVDRLLAALGHDPCIAGFKDVRAALPERQAGEAERAFVTFGSLRGLDAYKNKTALLVAGRPLPPPWSILAAAKAFFFDDPAPVPAPASFVVTDDEAGSRKLVYPADPRFQAMQRQLCDEEVNQAIGRLRLVWRQDPALVLVAADIPATRHGPWATTMSWDEIVPPRLALALLEAEGVLPLSAKLLRRRWPDRWATEGAAETDVRAWRKGTHDPQNPVDRLYRVPSLFYHGRSTGFPAGVSTLSPARVACRRAGWRGPAPTVLVAPWATEPVATLEAAFGVQVAFWQEEAAATDAAVRPDAGAARREPERPPARPEPKADPLRRVVEALARGAGILPLSSAELARLHPDLWPNAKAVDNWRARNGGPAALEAAFWRWNGRSEATRVSYRRPGHKVGDPHQALLPGRVGDSFAAFNLRRVVGEATAVQVLGVIGCPLGLDAPAGVGEPEPAQRPHPAVRPRVVGNLALAADAGEAADSVSPVVVARPCLAAPANANAAPWTDDRWWASGFLSCRTADERLLHLRRWVEAAGGAMVATGGTITAELPPLEPGMARVELRRFCRQLGVAAREARR
jgi:hypothetical protein